MTAPAAIKQADLKRIAAIAKSEGVVVEIEHNGMKIRVSADKSKESGAGPIAAGADIDL